MEEYAATVTTRGRGAYKSSSRLALMRRLCTQEFTNFLQFEENTATPYLHEYATLQEKHLEKRCMLRSFDMARTYMFETNRLVSECFYENRKISLAIMKMRSTLQKN